MEAKRTKREFTTYWQCDFVVLEARLLYPTDHILEQLENRLEKRQFLGRKAMRKIGEQLDTRVVELQNGG
jgi:hypothetical protein